MTKLNQTNMNSEEPLKQQVESTRKRYEGLDTVSDLDDPLDIEYRVRYNGNINEVVLSVTVGGPNIRVYLSKGVVKGTWGSAQYTSFLSNKSLLEGLFTHYRSVFEQTIQ